MKMSEFSKLRLKFRKWGSSFFTFSCVYCGKPVRGCLCEECRQTLVPANNPNPDMASAYYYETAAKKALLRCKFYSGEYCMDMLGDWLCEAYEHFSKVDFDCAVPVPSNGGEKSLAYKLAKEFCVLKDIPFRPEYLKKIRKTAKQHDILPPERKTNLIGAFKASPEIKGKTVLLIDDIITTGSTVKECSNAMLEAGVKKIYVLTVLKSTHDK